MADNDLRELLARVHEHLSSGTPVTTEVRQQLGTVLGDIERALGAGAESAHSAPRLESLAVKFEATHPQLADSLRQLIDVLGKGGI